MTCVYCDKAVEHPKETNICKKCFDKKFVVMKHVKKIKK